MTRTATAAPRAPEADGTEPFFGMFRALAAIELPGLEIEPPFDGMASAFYASNAEKMAIDRDWYLAHLPERTGLVVDLCCGSGRIVHALAAAGYSCVGVDNSPAMIERARRRMAASPPETAARAELREGDAIAFDLGRKADCVVIGGLSVTLFLDERARRRLLDSARRQLRPGGRLLFDFSPLAPGASARTDHRLFPLRMDGCQGFIVVGHRREPGAGRQLTNFFVELVAPDLTTRRFLSAVPFTMLRQEQLEEELRTSGFEVVETHDPFSGTGTEEFPELSWRLVGCEATA